MQQTIEILGLVSGFVSLAGIIYLVGHWKGAIDSKIGELGHCNDQYPPSELWMMCKTMWDIYVINVLNDRPGLAEKGSPWKLKPQAKELIPQDLMQKLNELAHTGICREDVSSGWLVVKTLGLDRISEMASGQGISTQEAVALLSTYLDERLNHCAPR